MRSLRTLALVALLACVPATGLSADSPQQQTTFGNLIAALNNLSVEIDELEVLDDLTIGDITVVNVEDVLNGNNVEALNNALNRNQTEILRLTNVLNNNNVLTDFLNNNDIAISDVIAVNVLSGGDVTVFVQPDSLD
jgi:hypothetical protein